jgi:hypothetical protein
MPATIRPQPGRRGRGRSRSWPTLGEGLLDVPG